MGLFSHGRDRKSNQKKSTHAKMIFMKGFLLCFMLFSSLPLAGWSRPGPSRLMYCLGQQEKFFHLKKQTGPFYELNQNLMGELIQIPGVEASAVLLNRICKPSTMAPLYLLEAIVLDPRDWYTFKSDLEPQRRTIAVELMKEFRQMSPEILLTFLASLQMIMPTADCLEKHIPGLSKMYHDVKWLQEEMDLKKITLGHKRLIPLFSRLQKYQDFAQECAKSKKTTSGSGKPSAR